MLKPDFSGDWVLNKDASTLSPGANTVQSAQWRIEHREPAFHHKGSFVFETARATTNTSCRPPRPPRSGTATYWS